MTTKLIIESGATKSDWRMVRDGVASERIVRRGMNVSSMPTDTVLGIVAESLETLFPEGGRLDGIYFYFAGIATDEIAAAIRAEVAKHVDVGESEILDDMTAAARAVCGHGRGVVAIMGTGSNSCYFDGEKVYPLARSGGFILGDEGGAAALGKLFLADLIKDRIPADVAGEFAAVEDASYTGIVAKIYHSDSPAAYLGSLAPFIVAHASNEHIRGLVEKNFREFIERALLKYPVRETGLGVVGGFGCACRDIFSPIAADYGIKVNCYVSEPIVGLIDYHK